VSEAIILFSHGSVVPGAGDNLLQLAASMRERGDAPIVEDAILNYTEPTLQQAFASCLGQGATVVTVMPYFLVTGKFVQLDLPRALAVERARYPQLKVRLGGAMTNHPALAAAISGAAQDAVQSAGVSVAGAALLVMVHGSPRPESNDAMVEVVQRVRAAGRFACVEVGFLECNQPDIAEAIARCVAGGAQCVVAVPYFLHEGNHVSNDLPQLLAEARLAHPQVNFVMADYIGRSAALLDVLRDRALEAVLMGIQESE
jgi:sirohydrochlorin cobaltochelatase